MKTKSLPHLTLLITSAVLFLACAVGPSYKQPEVKLPKKIKQAKGQELQTKDLDIVWWQSFKDPVLNNLIEKSVESNKSVQQALSRVNQARAIAKEAFSELLPGFQLAGSYEKRKISGVQFGGTGTIYELYRTGIDAAWEIDLFGRLRRNLEATNASYNALEAELDNSVQILISDLANAYFQLRASQQQLKIAKNNLQIQEETIRIVKAKLAAGLIGELDLARSTAQLAQTNAMVPPLQSMVNSNIHRISVLCGKNPNRFRRLLKGAKPVPFYHGSIQVGKIEDILRRRPDIRIAERRLAQSTALIGVQVADYFPKLSLTGDLGYENRAFDNLTDANRQVYGFGPKITWSPLDLGSIRARINAADAKAEESLLFYQETILKALEDVENSFSNLNAQAARTQHLQTAFESSQKAYQLAQAQYQVGELDLLSVLDAQASMLNNENELAVNQQSYATAIVNIYKALGGGWEAWEVKAKEK